DIVEISGHDISYGKTAGGTGAGALGGSLRLSERHHAHAVGLVEVIGQHNGTLGRPKILDSIPAIPTIAPRNPRSRPAGKLAIAKVQPGLDQPIVRLVSHGQAATGCSGFKIGISDFARQLCSPPAQGPMPVQYTWKNTHRQPWSRNERFYRCFL